MNAKRLLSTADLTHTQISKKKEKFPKTYQEEASQKRRRKKGGKLS